MLHRIERELSNGSRLLHFRETRLHRGMIQRVRGTEKIVIPPMHGLEVSRSIRSAKIDRKHLELAPLRDG